MVDHRRSKAAHKRNCRWKISSGSPVMGVPRSVGGTALKRGFERLLSTRRTVLL